MGMDVDYIAASMAIEELSELLSNHEHGDREKIADEIINFVDMMKEKWEDKKS